MHKSIPLAVIALFLIASPSIMFGSSNSNLFSKAMAIEQDGSKTDIKSFIKSNEVKDKGTSDGDRDKTSFIKSNEVKDKGTSDGDRDKTSFIKSNEVKDKGTSDGDRDKTSFIKSNEVKDKGKSSDDEDKSKSLAATKSSDDEDKSKSLAATDNFKGQKVQTVAGVPELQCDECVEYWALAIK